MYLSAGETAKAAEMYLSAGETARAAEIMAENGWVEMLVDVGRKADKADHQTLSLCAQHLRQLKARTYAIELYRLIYFIKEDGCVAVRSRALRRG
ncbi:intraflagellar transport protein 122 homolog [Hyalella azteca]|uniref:Intraflagellar transport protein 122 homolog n=1 Tax=Hyalella azteca TaxID=294128 RepID=A0A979FXF7_HYAAZ|nr:intraflagellar transport protein 122 homolog [Hyalella azteca]